MPTGHSPSAASEALKAAGPHSQQHKTSGYHLEGAPRLLDDVDALQVATPLEAHDGVHCKLSKVLLLLSEDLGTAGREGSRVCTES